MRRARLSVGIAVVAVAALAAVVPFTGSAAQRPQTVVAGYFASWDIYGRGYHPKDIPADAVTHLDYAFGTPTAGGLCAPGDAWADYLRPYPKEEAVDGIADSGAQHLFGNFNQLVKLKAAHPSLELLISVGGWTLSKYFSDVAATPAARAAFAKSCIDTFIKGELPGLGGSGEAAGLFDGIDIDWEYPVCCGNDGNHNSPADKHNATLLLQELRKQLDELGQSTGKHYLLTAALPAGNVRSAGSFELADVAKSLDWINLLTFDFHGPWDTWTDFNSPFGLDSASPTPSPLAPFWNSVGTVDFYLAQGVPADKIVLGMPFYARQYTRVPGTNAGLYQPFDNTGLDPTVLQWDLTPTPTYHDLVDNAKIVTPTDSHGNNAKGLNGFARYWNEQAGEPWLYNGASQRFISYDDPHSIAERTHYVQSRHLRGAFFWEISQDDDAHELVNGLSPLLTTP